MVQQISQLRVDAEMAGDDAWVASATAMTRATGGLDQAVSALGGTVAESDVKIINASGQFERYRLRVDAVARAERDLDRVKRSAVSALEQGRATQEEVNATIAQYERRVASAQAQASRSYGVVRAEMRETAAESRSLAQAQADMEAALGGQAAAYQRLTDRLDPASAALRRFKEEQKLIEDSVRTGTTSQEAGARALARLRAEYISATDAAGRHAAANDNAAASSGRMAQATQLLTRGLAALGVFLGARQLWQMFDGAEERVLATERGVARLNAQLAVTGGAVGKSLEDIRRLAREIEADTGIAEQVIMDRAAALTTFTTIAGEQFDRTMRVAADMAEVYQQDLKSALEAVGRAVENPLKGMGMLERQGFRLEAQQKEQIKTLIEQGRQYEAQEIVLRMLEDLVGGSAAAAYTGLAREQDRAARSGRELLEQWYQQSGAATASVAVYGGLATTFEWLALNTTALGDAAQFAALALGGLLVGRTVASALAVLPGLFTSAATALYTFAAANGAYTASAVAATAATRAFGAAVAFLGGPVGAVLAVAGLGAAAWLTYGRAVDTSGEAVERSRRTMEEINRALETGNIRSAESASIKLRAAHATDALTKSLIREAEARLAVLRSREGGAFEVFRLGGAASGVAIEKLEDTLIGLRGELEANAPAIAALETLLQELRASAGGAATATGGLTDEQARLRNTATESLAAIRAETAGLKEIAAGYATSTEAGLRAEAMSKARIASLKNEFVNVKALADALVEQARAQQNLAATQQLANDRQATAIAQARAQAAAIADPSIRRAREIEIERMEYRNKLEQEYALTLERIPELMSEWDQQKAYEEHARFWNDVRSKAEEISGDISQFLVDGFVNAERGGQSAFKNLWDGAMAGAKRFVANMVAEFAKSRIIMSIVMSVVGGSAAAFGIAGAGGLPGAAANIVAPGGGGLGLGSLSSLTGLLNGGLSSSFLTNIGLDIANSGIGQALGLSNAVAKGGSIVSSTGASFAGALGNLPYAGIGGLLGGLMGFTSGNAFIDMGLSTLGGIGGSMLGSGIGMLGAAGGPIGAIVGGLVGTLASSLFEKKPSNKFAQTNIDLAAGTVGAASFAAHERSQTTIDASQQMAKAFLEAAQAIEALTGGTGAKGAFVVAGERDGFQAYVGGQNARFGHRDMQSFSDPEEALKWMIAEFAKSLKGVEDADYRTILNRGGSAEKIIEGLDFVSQLKALTAEAELPTVARMIGDVRGQWDALIKQAKELGVSTDAAVAARNREIAAINAQAEAQRASFNDQLSIREMTLAGNDRGVISLQLEMERRRQLDEARQAVDLGIYTESQFARLARLLDNEIIKTLTDFDAALAAATQAANDNAIRAEMPFWQESLNAGQQIVSFLDRQALSGSASPVQRFNEAERQYRELLAAVPDDLSLTGNLTSAAQTFLDASRQRYASSPMAAQIEQMVRGDLASLGATITSEKFNLERILTAIQRADTSQQDLIRELIDKVAHLERTLAHEAQQNRNKAAA